MTRKTLHHGATGIAPAYPVDRSRAVLMALRRIVRAIDLRSRALIQQCGLTSPQLIVLHDIGGREVSVGDLAQRVSLSQATITGILDRLERRGIVARRRDDGDKRRVLARLTPAGARVLAEAPPMLQHAFVERFARLAGAEQAQLIAALERVVSMMEASELDATTILTTGPIDAA